MTTKERLDECAKEHEIRCTPKTHKDLVDAWCVHFNIGLAALRRERERK